MIYLVYGEQELLVNKMIDKIAKDTLSNIDEFNYVVLDAYKHDALQVVSELESFCFSSDKKVVVLTNSYFLTNNNSEGPYEYELIENYLENQTEGTTFVISVNSAKLDEKRNIVKGIRKTAKVVEVDSINKKDLPKIGMVADTPMGMGKVVSVDVFKKTYSVDLKEKGIVEFSKDDMKNGSSKWYIRI